MRDDDFEPRLGKPRNKDTHRRFAHELRAAINRAGGKAGSRKGTFTGKRLGRGGVVAGVLASRDEYAAYRQRRVIVKARIVKLAGKGMDGAVAHLRYVQRDGTTRDGERGTLYNAEHDRVEGREFLEPAKQDRHQFRFIVAAEDALEYEDLKPLTRQLMAKMEEDLETRLDWVAVDHYNTGHPHTHIIVRGTDMQGKDLVITPAYIREGIRERAAEIVRMVLGPQTEREILTRLRAEIDVDRMTRLDRQLTTLADEEGKLSLASTSPTRQTLLTGRLKHLERLGLATSGKGGQWQIAPTMEATLRQMGERGDILKTMHRIMGREGVQHSPADYTIHDPSSGQTTPIIGRVLSRGLADEQTDRHFLIVDATDGRSHYVDIGAGAATGQTPIGCIVEITPRGIDAKPSDHKVAEVAAANNGRYSIDLHMRHDSHASQSFAEAHVRRLEAIRRATGAVTREPSGTWIIPANHLETAAAYEQAKARPFTVTRLSSLTLEQQVVTHGATWLDHELVAKCPDQPRDSGFGRELREAMTCRQQWLMQGKRLFMALC